MEKSPNKFTFMMNFLSTFKKAFWLFLCLCFNLIVNAQTTYTVTNTNDSGSGSLRQAIIDANGHLGADIIHFSIGAGGLQTIAPLSTFPNISEAVMINATTQTGYAGVPLIEINGTSTAGATCFTVTGGNTTIRGFIINRFSGNGISLVTGNGNTIAGNYIGTNSAGTATLGAMAENIQVRSANNTIGGSTTADRNIIAGGTEGLRIYGATATSNIITNNYIGTGINGTEALGFSDDGLDIGTSAANNTIGGTSSNLANIIRNATGDGIEFRSDAGTGNVILGNSIFSSGGNGIDFNQDGITANDAGDGDNGPNGLQNYPILTSASSSAGGTNIVGTLNSNASTTYRVEFFSNSPLVAGANGEGQVYLGFVEVTTNVSGNATINTTLVGVFVGAGDKVSATATVKTGGSTYGSTSEFAANVTATSTIAPGGVTSNLGVWLKADAGATTGATFSWADQTSNARNASQATAGNQPTVATASMNYNPAVTFDGADDFLNVANSAGLPSGAAQVHGFGVARNLDIAGQYNTVFCYGISSTHSVFSLNKHYGNANTNLTTNSIDVVSSAGEFANNSTVLFDGKYTGTQGVLSSFGKQQATNSFVHNLTAANATVGAWLGGIDTWWNGNISEVILYSTNLSALDAQKVNSYLALKYGITLDQSVAQNYIASDGTVFWDGNTYSIHKHNIAGIVRNDASGLNQKQSKSANAGFQVAIGHGNTIATTNAANSNNFSTDKSALVWGDNSASVVVWTSTGAPASRQVLARTWRVQETGTVGSVKVQVPDNSGINGLPTENTTVYLLVDADGNFTTGATEIAMTLNGTNWEANVDLTNGQFFTFATQPATAPGGVVSSNFLWLKADAGVTTSGSNVTQWADAGNYGVTGTAFNNPTLYTNNHNFNPAVTFNGTNAYIDFPDGFANFTAGASGFVIGRPTASKNFARFFDFGNGSFDNNLNLRRIATTNDYSYESVNGITNSVTTIANAIVNNEVNEYGFVHAATTATLYKNGENLGSGPAQNLVNITRINNYIARSNWAGDDYYQGDMAEIILFNKNLTNTERQKVESYLAIKYGKTLDQTTAQNYLASDGTTIFWNGTTNSTHKNNIAGIARDDLSALNQKQSKSVNSGLQVAMGNGNTIATDNISNTNNFSVDKSALAWGDNAGSISAWTTASAPSSRQILTRTWKVQETGTVGSVKVQIADNSGANGLPAEGTSIYLLTDADGNFASGATTTAMTLNGTNWEANIDLTNGQFFTFGTELTANAGTFAAVSACIDVKSSITPTHNNDHNATNTQHYVLCNAQGIIMQVNTTPSFSTCGIGDFTVYAVNYPTNGVTNLTVGTDISALTGSPTNYDIEPLGITVCKTICGKYNSITPQ
jgi:hypothetical protein